MDAGRAARGLGGALPFWEDPSSSALNRRRSHPPLRSFVSREAAVRAMRELPVPPVHGEPPSVRGDRRQLLSGCNWRFRLYDAPKDLPDGFYAPGFSEEGYCDVSSAW